MLKKGKIITIMVWWNESGKERNPRRRLSDTVQFIEELR